MSNLIIDPEFKSLIPPPTPDEYQQLEQNLLNDGCLHELIIWDGIIVDGHNRYEICEKHGIPYRVKVWHFDSRDDAKEWIIRNQFGRRNISINQRALLALQLDDIVKARAKEKQLSTLKQNTDLEPAPKRSEPIHTDKELAKAAGVSPKTIQYARVIQKEGTEEQKRQFETGEKKIKTIYREIRPKKQPKPQPIKEDPKHDVDFSILTEEPRDIEDDTELTDALNKMASEAELMTELKSAICVPVVAEFLLKSIKEKLSQYPDTLENANNPDRKAFVYVFNILKNIVRKEG